jgi:hypothetical protein
MTTVSEIVREWLDRLPMDEEFTSKEYIRDIQRKCGKTPQTIMRRLTEWGHEKAEGFYIICISPGKSRYKKVGKKYAKLFLRVKRHRQKGKRA